MPKYTEHYNLKKPLQEEFYDIDDHNGNMDIIDSILKLLSEDSGVVISPDEPEKGDVWIDTDDEVEGGGGAVTSVNGKTGDVNLTAKDLDAYTVGETYSKVEVNELLPKAYTHPDTHPASMITETDEYKIFTAAEREKLAGIAEKANKYTHPSTHPASMITGLADTLSGLGYGKLYSGTGYCGKSQTSVTLTLPVKPAFVIVFNLHDYDTTVSTRYALNVSLIVQGATENYGVLNLSSSTNNPSNEVSTNGGVYTTAALNGTSLTIRMLTPYSTAYYIACV